VIVQIQFHLKFDVECNHAIPNKKNYLFFDLDGHSEAHWLSDERETNRKKKIKEKKTSSD